MNSWLFVLPTLLDSSTYGIENGKLLLRFLFLIEFRGCFVLFRNIRYLINIGWIRIRMDLELLPGSGSGTRKIQSWIRIRNKSFRIHNTGDGYSRRRKALILIYRNYRVPRYPFPSCVLRIHSVHTDTLQIPVPYNGVISTTSRAKNEN